MLSKVCVIVAAVLLAVSGAACADEPRPVEAGTGEIVAWVHLRGGEHVTFRAAGKQFPVRIGTPLVRSDVLEVPSGEFVVVKLRNAYLVKIDEDTSLAVAKIVSLDAPPTKESLASQLDRVLTKEERGRAERIAGTQARLSGAESVAPQSASPPPPPAARPAASPPAAQPPPSPRAASRESAAPAKSLSRGLALEESAAPSAPPSERAEQTGAAASPGGLGLGLRGSGIGGGGTGAGSLGGLGRIGTRGLGQGSGYGSGGGSAAGGRAAPRSAVNLGELEVRGALDKKLVTAIIKRHQSQLRYCYERALQGNPTLAGKLVLKVVVGADGAVAAVEVKETPFEPAVGACAATVARRWQFPPPASKGGAPGIVMLTVPLHFTASAP